MTNTTKQHAQAGKQTAAPAEAGVQQQHQDLIRLIAQHFNQQFYQQMAASQQFQVQLQQPTNEMANAINFQSPLALAQFQQHQHQIRASQDAMNFSQAGAITSDRLLSNLELPARSQLSPISGPAAQHQHHQNHHHHHQQQQQQPQLINNQALGGLPINPSACNNPFLGDAGMNLFNALNCFNANTTTTSTTSEQQFLLSLQQQYLLQAASTVRQTLESSRQPTKTTNNSNTILNNNDGDHHFNNHHHNNLNSTTRLNAAQNHLQSTQRTDRRTLSNNDFAGPTTVTGGGSSGETPSVESQSGGELLKFSINTILGRGSPNSTLSTGIIGSADMKSNRGQNLATPAAASINQYLTEQDRILTSSQTAGKHPTRADNIASTPECDADIISTDIDSNSSLASTPQPPGTANHHNQGSNNLQVNDSQISFDQGRLAAAAGSMNLAGHRLSASGSSNNQRTSGELVVGDQIANQQQQQLSPGHNHQHHHHQSALSFLAGSNAFPWTVAARGKPRRGMMRRAVFSDSQRVGLEKRFQLQKYISKPDRKKLAEKLGLRDSQVKIWFQNRRMKWRNSKERELLSAGGSREQTLPTRNNPNPDLSDVGETIKRLVTSSNSIGAV